MSELALPTVRHPSPGASERRCHGTAASLAVAGSTLMLPALLALPALLLFLAPVGVLWLCTVVGPGMTLTVRFYRYVLGHSLPGGARKLWTQTATVCGIYGAVLLYLCAAFGGGALAVLPLALCVMSGAALVARDKDRNAA